MLIYVGIYFPKIIYFTASGLVKQPTRVYYACVDSGAVYALQRISGGYTPQRIFNLQERKMCGGNMYEYPRLVRSFQHDKLVIARHNNLAGVHE